MHVRYEVDDHVAVITLDRPDALNAFTDHMEAELIACLDESDADDAVRAVVLTGAGRAFCAGMDLTPAADGPFEEWRRSAQAPPGTQFEVAGQDLPIRRDGGGRVALRVFDSRKPIVAAINGHAVGVGITMTLPCDIRIMSDAARVCFPFVRRGFVPESCSSWFLPRVVPIQQALEWTLTGRMIDAQEALAAGLVLRVCSREEVLPVALELAREISANAPGSTSFTRRVLWRMQTAAHPMVAHEIETLALNLHGVGADAHEGVRAFLEKREPVFTGEPSEAEDLLAGTAVPVYSPPESR